MIRVEHLVYEYPGLRALDNVSFFIPQGGITALVGPNGAGKTTLLRCLAGLDQPMTGQIHIDGIDVLENPRECHRRIGYLSDFFGLYDALTVRQCLQFAGESCGIDRHQIHERIVSTARELDIANRLDVRASALSRGLRQRLAIGQAIIHAPKVLLLDEPASGLDPEARHELSLLFNRLRDRGMTLIVSSHILAELKEYSSDMLIMRGGHIVEQTHLTHRVETGTRLRVDMAIDTADLRERLMKVAQLELIQADMRSAVIVFRGDRSARHQLLRDMLAADLPVCGLVEETVNLQEYYMSSIQKADESRGTK